MTLPIPVGIKDETYTRLYRELNFVQRQIYVISSSLIGGVFGGCAGTVIAVAWKMMGSNSPNIIEIWIVLGIIQGIIFLGQLSGIPYVIDALGYVIQITIMVVFVGLFFPHEFGNANLLFFLIIPISSWVMLIIPAFITLHIGILRRILGESAKPSVV